MPNPISLMMVPWEPSNRPPSVFLRVFVASAPSLHCRRLKTNRVRGIIRFLRDRWRISLPLSFEEKSDHWTELTLSMFLVCIFFQSRNVFSSFLPCNAVAITCYTRVSNDCARSSITKEWLDFDASTSLQRAALERNNARNNLDKIISKLRQSLGSLQIINYRVTFAHTNLRVFPYLEPVITTLLFSIISHGRDDRHWMETAGQITFPRGGSKDVSYSAILPPGPN